jgi:bifunctional ADP-heptose synthase (sugar kinase/adenylyltransferase)
VDFIYARAIPETLERELVARLTQAAPEYDVILVSDQAETSQGGVITRSMRDAIGRIALAQPGTVVWVDSRLRPEHFRHTVVKPNRQEAEAASMRALGRIDYAELRRRMEARSDDHPGAPRVCSWWTSKVRPDYTRPVENPVDIRGAIAQPPPPWH